MNIMLINQETNRENCVYGRDLYNNDKYLPFLTSGFRTSCINFNGIEPGIGAIDVHRRAVLPNSRWFIAEELAVPIMFCPLQAAKISVTF